MALEMNGFGKTSAREAVKHDGKATVASIFDVAVRLRWMLYTRLFSPLWSVSLRTEALWFRGGISPETIAKNKYGTKLLLGKIGSSISQFIKVDVGSGKYNFP